MKRRTAAACAAALMVVAMAGCSSGTDHDESSEASAEAPAADAQKDSAGGEGAPDADENTDKGAGDGGGSGGANSGEPSDGVITQAVDDTFQREIIYTIGLEITTEDLDAAAQRAATVVQTAGGFVADETTSERSSTLTLRIPVKRHANAVDELQKLGTVTNRTRSSEDVTQQVVDTESRIASQRRSISRIRALLGDATDLSDVVSIEEELAGRESDLDSLLSQQKQLADLTTLATVTVTFRAEADQPEEEDEETASGFLSGLSNGWGAFTAAVGGALTVLGAILPFLVLVLLVGVPGWIWYRRRRPQPVVRTPVPPPAA